jgi:hypothetical protein
MRSVAFPIDLPDPLELLETGLGGPGTLTSAQRRALRGRYMRYLTRGGMAHVLPPAKAYRGNFGQRLQAAYAETYGERRLAFFRARLLKAVANRCPSCGGARPGELDHYLPISKYPEYSVFPWNLYGCCGECNRRLSATVPAVPHRQFLHPYLDRIPDVPMHSVALRHASGALTADISFDPTHISDPLLVQRITHHLNRVDVGERLRSEAEELIKEKADTVVAEMPAATAGEVIEFLESEARRYERTRAGDWRGTLMRALAADGAFCGGGYKAL